eukprot:TRINITY_DN57847_c0_g1_i1.p1 TRINITY_DN57847_c0_g1~~TRINITY_DN57847_c0_g1_i1.p1  ORF type:complete len:342 (-),score=90.89 TRINITY_DN57847_c0_g1_i1:36-1001(-)
MVVAAATPKAPGDVALPSLAPKADLSDSSDDDWLPPLDPHWTSMLNVSKVGNPLPPLKPSKEVAGGKSYSGKGGKGKHQYRKGQGLGWRPPDSDGMGSGAVFNLWNSGKGSKGSSKGGQRGRRDDVMDFFVWAQDPSAEDGSRPRERERSRSPRRGAIPRAGPPDVRMEDFLTWARDNTEVELPLHDDDSSGHGTAMNSFMEWATTEPPEPAPEEETTEYLGPPLEPGAVLAVAASQVEPEAHEEDGDDKDDGEKDEAELARALAMVFPNVEPERQEAVEGNDAAASDDEAANQAAALAAAMAAAAAVGAAAKTAAAEAAS